MTGGSTLTGVTEYVFVNAAVTVLSLTIVPVSPVLSVSYPFADDSVTVYVAPTGSFSMFAVWPSFKLMVSPDLIVPLAVPSIE